MNRGERATSARGAEAIEREVIGVLANRSTPSPITPVEGVEPGRGLMDFWKRYFRARPVGWGALWCLGDLLHLRNAQLDRWGDEREMSGQAVVRGGLSFAFWSSRDRAEMVLTRARQTMEQFVGAVLDGFWGEGLSHRCSCAYEYAFQVSCRVPCRNEAGQRT